MSYSSGLSVLLQNRLSLDVERQVAVIGSVGLGAHYDCHCFAVVLAVISDDLRYSDTPRGLRNFSRMWLRCWRHDITWTRSVVSREQSNCAGCCMMNRNGPNGRSSVWRCIMLPTRCFNKDPRPTSSLQQLWLLMTFKANLFVICLWQFSHHIDIFWLLFV